MRSTSRGLPPLWDALPANRERAGQLRGGSAADGSASVATTRAANPLRPTFVAFARWDSTSPVGRVELPTAYALASSFRSLCRGFMMSFTRQTPRRSRRSLIVPYGRGRRRMAPNDYSRPALQ